MDRFVMNGYLWRVVPVDPWSDELVDRTGKLTLATTDPVELTVFVSNSLEPNSRAKVLVHELGHCALFSFGLLDDIRRMCKPDHWLEAEEWVCNFIADYGFQVFRTAAGILGSNAWKVVPPEIEAFVA